jgi:hypothetical protein
MRMRLRWHRRFTKGSVTRPGSREIPLQTVRLWRFFGLCWAGSPRRHRLLRRRLPQRLHRSTLAELSR